MSSDRTGQGPLAVSVRSLGKAYTIKHQRAPQSGTSVLERLKTALRPKQSELFWALQDVSFDVRKGEVVGFVGRNGAGKSTLLKVLSRITLPTSGEVDLFGSFGSLLEVGTGFHRELTGRENIYLNGSILGMSRQEITASFDEIVAFAGSEKFLDTPVKRYSSGMYVRLAFSVAAHLRPDILIVDEVLSVGDAEFQRKCLGKMEQIAQGGRTVLFVSHHMGMVRSLCNRVIVLNDGSIVADGDASGGVAAYLALMEEQAGVDLVQRTDRAGRGQVRLRRLSISGGDGMPEGHLLTGGPARFEFCLDHHPPGTHVSFTIYDAEGTRLTSFHSASPGAEDVRRADQDQRLVCRIEELGLVAGEYRLNAAVSVGTELEDHVEAAARFSVQPGAVRGRPIIRDGQYGSVTFAHVWERP